MFAYHYPPFTLQPDSKFEFQKMDPSLETMENGNADETSPTSEHTESTNNSALDTKTEDQHFFDIVNTFRAYKRAFLKVLTKRRGYIISDKMTSIHRLLLAPYTQHLNRLEVAAAHNHEILKLFIAEADGMYANKSISTSVLVKKPDSQLNTDRLNSVLNQLAREWTAEGASERASSYGRILATLVKSFPPTVKSRSTLRVLVPGVGLGRLSFEIARLGFISEGNEFSLMMLFVANYILNETKTANALSFYPYISQFSNNLSTDKQLTRINFPDVCPNETGLPPGAALSMVAGPFLDVYAGAENRNSWDAVVTCFFLDTAANVLDYTELIKSILKPTGLWINFGPLMYHWEDDARTPSIEPSYDIIHKLIEASGFEFLEEETGCPSAYTCNPHSMLSYTYKCVFFVCRKKEVSL